VIELWVNQIFIQMTLFFEITKISLINASKYLYFFSDLRTLGESSQYKCVF
jgi:hypothetical protein